MSRQYLARIRTRISFLYHDPICGALTFIFLTLGSGKYETRAFSPSFRETSEICGRKVAACGMRIHALTATTRLFLELAVSTVSAAIIPSSRVNHILTHSASKIACTRERNENYA